MILNLAGIATRQAEERDDQRLEAAGVAARRLHGIWGSMHHRCRNPRAEAFKRYGAAGIKVCDEWATFDPFFSWAVANGYAPDLTLDRRENDRGYSPNNCRWATRLEQVLNRRCTIWIEIDGERRCAADWARSVGLRHGTVLQRHRAGWTGADLLLAASPRAKSLRIVSEKGGGDRRTWKSRPEQNQQLTSDLLERVKGIEPS